MGDVVGERGAGGRRRGSGRGRGGDRGAEGASGEKEHEQSADVGEAAAEGKKRTSARVKKEDGSKGEGDKGLEKNADAEFAMSSSKQKNNTTTGRTKVKKEEEGPDYLSDVSDEAEWGDETSKKLNIENINGVIVISDGEDDNNRSEKAKGKQPQKPPKPASWQLRPVRLTREAHVERQVGVNTDASSAASAELRKRARERQEATGSLFIPESDVVAEVVSKTRAKGRRKARDVEFVRDERRWKGVYQDEDDEDDVLIKEEPNDDADVVAVEDQEIADAMDVDEEQATSGAKVPTTVDGVPMHEAGDAPTMAARAIAPRRDSSSQPAVRRPKILGYRNIDNIDFADDYSEDDDFAELIKIWKDVQAEHAGTAASNTSLTASATHSTQSSDLKGNPERIERTYLMQLPPILPSLRDSSKPAQKLKSEDKSKTPKKTPEANPFATPIKPDPDSITEPSDTQVPGAIPNAYTVTSLHPPSGHSGTLTFYDSGKISAEWGGMELDVKRMAQAGFAQEVLVHDYDVVHAKVEDESRWEEVVRCGQEAWAMGRIEGGFVGGVEWGSLLGG